MRLDRSGRDDTAERRYRGRGRGDPPGPGWAGRGGRFGHDALVAALRAAGEPTRLRILALLGTGDLSVKDLTTILGQSQPRISRHLKLLLDAGLIARSAEGAFAYFRLAEAQAGARFADHLLGHLDPADPVHSRDRERLDIVRKAHAEAAAAYFAENAATWDHIRSLHVPEAAVEAAMRDMVGERRIDAMLDVGTGTGRVLELYADLYQRGLGVDQSAPMLSVARANLEGAGIGHARLAQGDIYALAQPRNTFDLVTIHQVLHYLDDPGRAIREAATTLRPGGRLLVVDFAPHAVETLRAECAHRRLGFAREEVQGWLDAAGLETVDVRDLKPEDPESELTVTLWLARDRRMLIAGAGADAMMEELA